jgi:hypothetical protein
VAAEHHDYSSFSLCGAGDRGDYRPEIACDQNIGQRVEKCGEAAILAGRRRKLGSGDLVGSPLDRDGADSGQIYFRRGWSTARRRGRSGRAWCPGWLAFPAGISALVTAYALGDGW